MREHKSFIYNISPKRERILEKKYSCIYCMEKRKRTN